MTLRVLAGHCGRCPAIGLVVTVVGAASPARSARGEGAPQGRVFTVHNESGMARTINVAGFPVMAVDNSFFLDLGVNGRRCITCYEPQSNMTLTSARLRARFDATEGNDAIFRPNEGSNSPLAVTSTIEARRAAYSILLVVSPKQSSLVNELFTFTQSQQVITIKWVARIGFCLGRCENRRSPVHRYRYLFGRASSGDYTGPTHDCRHA